MTIKKNYSEIQSFVFFSCCFVFLIFVSLHFNGYRIDSGNWKAIVLFLFCELMYVGFSFLGTNGGFFTDTITINEEGIVFALRKETISYKWEEIEKVHYHYGRGGHSFGVYAWNRPAMSCIHFRCSKEFRDYFFQVYPNIQK